MSSCRRVITLLALFALGATASCTAMPAYRAAPHHAHLAIRTIRMAQYPYAVIDDSYTRRIFVLDGATVNANLSGFTLALNGVTVLNATTGEPIHTEELRGYVSLPLRDGAPVVSDPRTGRIGILTSPRIGATGTVSGRAALALLNGKTGRLLRTFPVGSQPTGVGIDAATRRIFVSDISYVHIIDETTGALVGEVPGGGSRFHVVVDARHERVYLISGAREVILDERTGAVLANRSMSTHGAEMVDAFVVDTRAGRVLVDLYDETTHSDRLCVVALASGRPISCTYDVGGAPMAADVVTGRTFAVSIPSGSNRDSIILHVLDTRSGRLVRNTLIISSADVSTRISIALDRRVGRVFVTSDAPSLFAHVHGRVTILDAQGGGVIGTMVVGQGTWEASPAVAVDEATGHVFVANTIDKTITMLDAARL